MATKFKPTDEQLAVIEHEGSHALVSAVAGAGKSTTLVEHVARRVQAGMDPRRILAIQYNKSAQVSMERKLKERLEGVQAPQARTFHSIGNAMLKRLIDVGALKPAKFKDEPGTYEKLQRNSLREAWKAVHGREAYPSQEQMEGFHQFVTRVKADIRSPQQVFRAGEYKMECQPYINAVIRMDEISLERGVYFYDDMLSRTYKALLEDPGLWTLFSDKFLEVAVDEFQDINPVQYALLDGIVGKTAECMAIGDPDQAIYAWRGSDVSFITEQFARDYDPCKLYRMTKTFRYGNETAMIANHVITKNKQRDDKLTVAAPGNPDTQVKLLAQLPKQPSGLVTHLQEPHRNGKLRKQAMLVRYYSQSVPYEIEMVSAGIPFHVYGREPLLLIHEIGSLVAALSLAADYWVVPPAMQGRLMTAMLSSPTLFATREVTEAAGLMMSDALDRGESVANALIRFSGTEKVKEDRLRQRLRKRADVIGLLEAGGLKQKTPAHVIDTYLAFTEFRMSLDSAASTRSQAEEVEQNVNAFKTMAARYPTIVEFLDVLGPLAAHRKDSPPEGDHLPVLSMHRAKGLEWSKVYLPGWSAASFPREHEDIEEERRLAYVAITRAINELVFLHPKDQTFDRYNTHLDELPLQGADMAASRFLYEGEVGLSGAVAEALRRQTDAQISCRRDAVVTRYLQEGGFEGVVATVPPHLVGQLRQTSLNPDLQIKPGDRLRNGQMLYEVTQKLGERYYYVKSLAGGDPRLISLDEPGWSVA